MLISLDYDETYNKDKEFWGDFILLARKYGHKVMCVTLRDKELDWHEDFNELNHNYEVETVFCNGVSKKYIMESKGLKVQWWIDDSPEFIGANSVLTPEELSKWRKEQWLST